MICDKQNGAWFVLTRLKRKEILVLTSLDQMNLEVMMILRSYIVTQFQRQGITVLSVFISTKLNHHTITRLNNNAGKSIILKSRCL